MLEQVCKPDFGNSATFLLEVRSVLRFFKIVLWRGVSPRALAFCPGNHSGKFAFWLEITLGRTFSSKSRSRMAKNVIYLEIVLQQTAFSNLPCNHAPAWNVVAFRVALLRAKQVPATKRNRNYVPATWTVFAFYFKIVALAWSVLASCLILAF